MQDLENRYIEIRVFEETEPEPPRQRKEKKRRDPIGPRIKELIEEGAAFGASVVEVLKESAEKNRAHVEMIQKERREAFWKRKAKRKQQWDELCNQFSVGKCSNAEGISEEMIREFFEDLGFGKKRKRA
jgi:hypothetical protein